MSGTESNPAASGRHLESLDGVRGLTACVVVAAHVGLFSDVIPFLSEFEGGYEAVGLFFALSGFLMVYLYAFSPFRPMDYLVRRFARIYPVYLVAVVLAVVLSVVPGLGYIYPLTDWTEIGRHVVALGSSGVFWSIPPEIQFYFYFLLIWLWTLSPQRHMWVMYMTVGLIAAGLATGFAGPGIFLFSKLKFFVFGVLAGYLYLKAPRLRATALSDCATLALFAGYFTFRAVYAPEASYWDFLGSAVAGLLIYLSATGGPLQRAIFVNPVSEFFGRISFSLYLFHVPVLFVCFQIMPESLPEGAKLLVALAASVGVSFATYSVVELPSRRFIVSWWRGRTARGAGLQKDLVR